MDKWINKMCICITGMLFILKQECNSDTCYNMDERNGEKKCKEKKKKKSTLDEKRFHLKLE
jgi:hypothetical protein